MGEKGGGKGGYEGGEEGGQRLKREMQMREVRSKVGDEQEGGNEEEVNGAHKPFFDASLSNPFPGWDSLLRKNYGR